MRTDAVAGMRLACIARVFAPGLVTGPQKRNHLRTGRGQQGAHNAAHRARPMYRLSSVVNCEHGRNAAKPFGPGTPQQLQHHGLRLVVRGVCGGDNVCPPLGQQTGKETQASMARNLFHPAAPRRRGCLLRGNIGVGMQKRHIKTLAQVAQEITILVSLHTAQPMVQMGRNDGNAKLPSQLLQREQKGRGVRSARHRNRNAATRRQQAAVQRERGCSTFCHPLHPSVW